MARTVVIQNVTHSGNDATVTGTVDGAPTQATFNFSSVGTFATAILAQTYLAGLLAATVPVVPVTLNTWNGTIVI